jgi:hypothetical protein
VSEPNEFRAYFTLTGEFEPADITVLIGLHPTEQWRKGEKFGQIKQLERKFSRWSLGTRLPRQSFLEDHVLDVLAQLEPVKERVAALKSEWEPNLAMVAYFKENPQGFFFSRNVTSALAEMKLGMDLSLYYEGEDESADILQ